MPVQKIDKDELKDLLQNFVTQAIEYKTGEYPTGFFPRNFVKEYKGCQTKASIGSGKVAKSRWFAFLNYGQEIKKGIYPIFVIEQHNQNANKFMAYTRFDVSEKNSPSEHWRPEILGKHEKTRIHKEFEVNNLDYNEVVDSIDYVIDQYDKQFSKNEHQDRQGKQQDESEYSLNQILYGPPGTGKTYNTVNLALDILGADGAQKETIKSIKQLQQAFGSQMEFVTFHQSFSYEDFVEGLRAVSENGQVTYKVELGIFKQICTNARNSGNDSLKQLHIAVEKLKEQVFEEPLPLKTLARSKPFVLNYYGGDAFYAKPEEGKWDNPVSINSIEAVYKNPKIESGKNGVHFKTYTLPLIQYLKGNFGLNVYQKTNGQKPHILIIDEINRGNISRILGELITLIEPSKRAGAKEEISVTLPYSKTPFSVPKNLYIIGTMNTADRSLAQIDTALRRRFEFIEMMPNSSVLTDEMETTIIDDVDLVRLLNAINQRIEFLHDREHTIGHAYLMNIDSLDKLKDTFANKILPLLEEYFFDDWQKIKAVLNDPETGGFYEPVEPPADLPDVYTNENVKIYRRTSMVGWNADLFKKIYG